MHVGMIGGIGPAATEFYYRNLVAVYHGESSQLDLTIVHADVNTMDGALVHINAIYRKSAEFDGNQRR